MKKGKMLFAVLCALALSLSSCNSSGSNTPDYSGDPRYEKYQLAVAAGYTGTYEEWLESIKGQDGKDGTSVLTGHGVPSSELGNPGDSYIDLDTWDYYLKTSSGWTKQGNIKGQDGSDGADGKDGTDGTNGKDGADGKDGQDGKDGNDGVSVVSIVKTSSDGLVDTYTITYSNGTTSTFTVTNGADGSQGIQGNPGQDGHTPIITIGDNGHWYIDGVDTGVAAQGPKGDPGTDGKDGITPHIGDNGNWWIGDEDTGIKAAGSNGANGTNGQDGADGVSIVSIEKTGSNGNIDTYTITFSNGETFSFNVTNGTDGANGINGQNGENGKTPYIGDNGNWWIGDEDTGVKAAGIDGSDGQDGTNGVSIISIELISHNGLVDTYRIHFSNGTSFDFTVTNGATGQQGEKGDQGDPGQDGVSVVSIVKTSSDGLVDTYTITYSNGTTSTFTVTNGADGSQGIQGNPGQDGHTPIITIGDNGHWYIDGVDTGVAAQGPKGDQGEQGEKGDTGVSIVNTYIDENGDLIVEFSDGTIKNAGHVKDVDTYTVNFYVDDDLVATREVPNGQTISRPTAEETAGYTISDWYIVDCGEHVSWKFDGYFAYTVHDNIDLYANFSYNTYSISFVDSVHQKQVEDLNVTYDSVYSLPSISEDGYTFVSWELNNEAFPNNGIYRIADSITLNAVWNANSYVVTLNPDGGSVSQNSLNVTFNSSYTLPTPTKTGYTFLGWYDGDTRVSSNATWKYSTNKTLKAKWSNTPMTFTFDAGDGDCSVDSMVILYDESYELPTPYLFGYRFDGWYINNTKVPQNGKWSYSTSGATLVARYINNADDLIVENGVITSSNFQDDNIELIIPSSVTDIGNKAFLNCSALKSVIISNGVNSIGEWAFGNCDNLESISIPQSIMTIKQYGLCRCERLNSVSIINGLVEIGVGAFDECTSLETLVLPESVRVIGSSAFFECGFSSIVIPEGVSVLSDWVLQHCENLTSVTLPNTITTIEEAVFLECSSIADIYYNGTIDEWNAIAKHELWNVYDYHGTGTTISGVTIHCTNGDINL